MGEQVRGTQQNNGGVKNLNMMRELDKLHVRDVSEGRRVIFLSDRLDTSRTVGI